MSPVETLREIVRSLCAMQPLAILATQALEQPYCNLVAFTAADDLKSLLIATPSGTAKYSNMLRHPAVALLIDSRCGGAPDFTGGIAVNCLGRAVPVSAQELESARQRHFTRHAALRTHFESPDCAMVRIEIDRYIIARGVRDIEVLAMR